MPTKAVEKITKHQELTRTLLGLARQLQPGDPFPSQTELMRRFQVSDRTVLRSLDDLRRAGWIVRRHGIGTFVADPGETLRNEPPAPAPAATPLTKTIAGLVLSLGPVYQHCIDLLSEQAEAAGYAFVCHHARGENSFEDVLPLEALRPQGFILFSYYLQPIAKRLIERGHRVVMFGAPPAGVLSEVPSVYNDQEFGGYQATRHLIDLGHRRLTYYYPETRYPLQSTIRWQGHLRAISEAQKAGLPVTGTVLSIETRAPWRDNPAACAAYFAQPDAPTGILAWNDEKAAEALHLLYRAGVRVPDDVSIVGYDALPIGARSIPPLTTVDSQIGTQLRAIMQLLTQEAPPSLNQSIIATPILAPNASSAPPSRSRKDNSHATIAS